MDFVPAYTIIVDLPEGRYQLGNLISLHSGLSTALTVGALTLVLADPTDEIGDILGQTKNNLPQSLMAPIAVRSRNIWGEWSQAWAGFISSAGPSFDPSQGKTFQISAGDAAKPFAVQTQSAADVAALTISEVHNLSASSVLKLAADKVGLSRSKLLIDVAADAGSGIQTSIPIGTFISPQQSSWLSVLNGIATFTGNILFANELGQIVYRPIDYTRPPVRAIPASIVHASTLLDSDEDIATYVQVRFGIYPTTAAAQSATEPTGSWAHQLGSRKFITTLPWILSPAAAQWAANTLLQQGMAQLGVGQVTIIGDATYKVGDTVRLLYAGKDAFIQTVGQSWQWNGQWLTTLGLTFVRDSGASIPRGVQPSKAMLAGLPNSNAVINATQAAAQASALQSGTTPHTFTLQATGVPSDIPSGYDLVGPASYFADGAVIVLQDVTTRKPASLGLSANGRYVVSASTDNAPLLLIYDAKNAGKQETVTVSFLHAPPPSAGNTQTSKTQATTTALAPPPAPAVAAQNAAQKALANQLHPQAAYGTYSRKGVYIPASAPSAATYWRDRVMAAAMRLVGDRYQAAGFTLNPTDKGAPLFSCVAMIWRAMVVTDFAVHLENKYPPDPKHPNSPNQNAQALASNQPVYTQHVLRNLPGNTDRLNMSAIVQGDILLFSGTVAGWAGSDGYSHAALALGKYNGPTTDFFGNKIHLKTDTAMITGNSVASGITIDDYTSPYWTAHFALATGPDYAR